MASAVGPREDRDAALAMARAVRSGKLSELKQLVLDNPCAVNVTGSAETSPVHVAVALKNRDALEIVSRPFARSPRCVAGPVSYRVPMLAGVAAVQMLRSAGCDLTCTNNEPDRQTALDLADELSLPMIVKILEEHGAKRTGRRAFEPGRPNQLPQPAGLAC